MKIGSARAPSAPRLRDRMREVAAAAILDSAEQVVAEQGIGSARIEEIARRAGVAVGTLYNYFADREGLIAALRNARKAELLTGLDAALTLAHGQPFRIQLEAFFRAALVYYEKHRQFFTMLLASEPSRAARPSREVLEDVYALTEKLMRAGVREGALRSEHASLYPGLLFAFVRASAMSEFQHKRGTHLPDLAAPLAELFLHGAAEKRG